MPTLLTTKELADQLRRSVRYVRRMKQRGFTMPGERATLQEARAWLQQNPKPCKKEKKK